VTLGPQQYRLLIREESTGRMLSNDVWQWRMMSGACVSINRRQYRVLRVVPHPAMRNVSVVWVEATK
jgi:hypothetical protein